MKIQNSLVMRLVLLLKYNYIKLFCGIALEFELHLNYPTLLANVTKIQNANVRTLSLAQFSFTRDLAVADILKREGAVSLCLSFCPGRNGVAINLALENGDR